jgi:hypothetical protein
MSGLSVQIIKLVLDHNLGDSIVSVETLGNWFEVHIRAVTCKKASIFLLLRLRAERVAAKRNYSAESGMLGSHEIASLPIHLQTAIQNH